MYCYTNFMFIWYQQVFSPVEHSAFCCCCCWNVATAVQKMLNSINNLPLPRWTKTPYLALGESAAVFSHTENIQMESRQVEGMVKCIGGCTFIWTMVRWCNNKSSVRQGILMSLNNHIRKLRFNQERHG